MDDTAKAMVTASFAADSLALGAHWIYDTTLIEQQFGRVERLLKPLPDSYHPGKDEGEFTHYGDQTLSLLASVAEAGSFDLNRFAESWRNLFSGYSGYFDKATKTTLDNFGSGSGPEASGSNSTDLGGASRIGLLVYSLREDLNGLIEAVRAQTAMTHNHPEVVDSAEFFARSALKVLGGTPPVEALGRVVDEHFNKGPYDRWVAEGVESAAKDSRRAIAGFGQMCETGAAFPAVVHLIAKYQGDLKEALIENVMAGGDSAARGMIVGMILGAFQGYEGIPDEWYLKMKKHDIILQLLEQIDRSDN